MTDNLVCCGMDFNTFKCSILQSPNNKKNTQTESQLKLFNCILKSIYYQQTLKQFYVFFVNPILIIDSADSCRLIDLLNNYLWHAEFAN